MDCDGPSSPVTDGDFSGSYLSDHGLPRAKISLHSTGTHKLINSSRPGNIQKKPWSGHIFSQCSTVINSQSNENSGHFSDFEILAKKDLGRREISAPVNQKEIKNQCSKVIKRVKPKLKENFASGRILKWGNFSLILLKKMGMLLINQTHG